MPEESGKSESQINQNQILRRARELALERIEEDRKREKEAGLRIDIPEEERLKMYIRSNVRWLNEKLNLNKGDGIDR